MSQASRRHALRHETERRQVEREIARSQPAEHFDDWAFERRFDVHAARAHALELLAMEQEQTVFEDWTRAKGLGPENREPGAFALTPDEVAIRIATGRTRGLSKLAPFHRRGGWPGKLAREWPGDSRAPMGRALARMGLRILDALEGQPSECQGLSGRCKGGHHEHWGSMDPPCPDCHGTGHNLRGKLPEVEWSPAARRRMADEQDGRGTWYRDHPERLLPPTWLTRLPISGLELPTGTRVCPRGEHRTGPLADRWTPERLIELHPSERPSLDVRVSSRTILAGAFGDGTWASLAKRPRWVRGEAEHARQRRERGARRDNAPAMPPLRVRASFTL